LLCQRLFANPQPPVRPHPLPQPLSQPHASTEANSPPLSALAKPKRQRRSDLGRGRSGNSVFLELAAATDSRIAAATTSWSDLQTEAQAGAEAGAEAEAEADRRASVIPSNHYALLAHFSRFVAHC